MHNLSGAIFKFIYNMDRIVFTTQIIESYEWHAEHSVFCGSYSVASVLWWFLWSSYLGLILSNLMFLQGLSKW